MKAKPFLIFSGERELKKLQKKLWELRLKNAQTLTGESEAKEFAKTIQEHLNEDNKLEVRVEKNDSTTVANLNAGYYLIKDKEGSQTPNTSKLSVYVIHFESSRQYDC